LFIAKESEKVKIKVAHSEFYQLFSEEIANGLGIKFFLSQNQDVSTFDARAVE
jgi:hypothetical protein